MNKTLLCVSVCYCCNKIYVLKTALYLLHLQFNILEQQGYSHHHSFVGELLFSWSPGVSNLWPMGHMQPRMAMNVAQHKIINLLKAFFFAHQFSLLFVYLMCGPKQLFFFQCGPEMPKERLDTPDSLC